MWDDLTIVTSCTGYGKYLAEWTSSILAQTVKPGHVIIFTHGSPTDLECGQIAYFRLQHAGIDATHLHEAQQMHLGAARNHVIERTTSEWVLHLDADDMLLPHAIAMCQSLTADADVISAGYVKSGQIPQGVSKRDRIYDDVDGTDALDATALCSSNSPFRRSFWEQSPYRTDMHGAWDTAFWIGLAHLGARFRATPKPIFLYRLHGDSVFAKRQRTMSWARVHTTAMLKALRRRWEGVAIIVPRDYHITTDRQRNWDRVRAHYQHHHPTYAIVEGKCPSATWCKGAAIANALNHTTAEILVIADADCIVDPYWLTATVELVRKGAAWGMPHLMVNRLTEQATQLILPDIPHDFFGFEGYSLDRERYEGAAGGGIVVIRRVNYEAIGGIPQAFMGWGSEDRAFALIATTLLGPVARGAGELLHLFHFPQPKSRLTQTNVQILQRLGQAAQLGKDALVVTLSTLPKSGSPRTLDTVKGSIAPAREAQTLFVQKQRRRIP